MEYEWDPTKATINFEKHAINFEDAITVFDDSDHFITKSTKPEHGEIRFLAIGMTHDGRMTAVVYTDRERRRIISARKVRKHEQREYDSRKTSTQR